MSPSPRVRRSLTSIGIGLYLVWIGATVLLVGAQLGVLPRFDVVHQTVVAGAFVLTALGTLQLAKKGVEKTRTYVE
ncbi:hypothetical protein SAMN04487948_101331 [Halogranum amylolyticum]|uniref:Uncharacterized protein n=1 Tax=Halogranum amylolyticum TaxID=660520 RepID=A0A1H8N5U9_9EURY|nr:hypothetical protein [Halogranum amylolyticum]SEO24922.1 hypothetical protein SAMN04487948_101331 [Halogranum amylolyticum]